MLSLNKSAYKYFNELKKIDELSNKKQKKKYKEIEKPPKLIYKRDMLFYDINEVVADFVDENSDEEIIKLHRNKTNFEAENNHMHMTDLYKEGQTKECFSVMQYYCSKILKFCKKKKIEGKLVFIIYIFNDDLVVNFHRFRQGESYVLADIDEYYTSYDPEAVNADTQFGVAVITTEI